MLDWIDIVTAVGLGLLLRVGLPIGLTVLLVGWLRWLDRRWQAEGEQQAKRLRPAVKVPPCWELRNCSPEQRISCPAYGRTDQPCWQIMRATTGRLPERCLECFVFLNAPIVNRGPRGGQDDEMDISLAGGPGVCGADGAGHRGLRARR